MQWRERLAATLLTIGAGMWVFVGVWFLAWARSTTRLGPDVSFRWDWAGQILLAGGILAAAGVGVALTTHFTRSWGIERAYPNARVLVRFCTSCAGEPILYPMGTPPSELRYYVRLQLPGGTTDEYECSFALYQRVREGMQGRAVCKGGILRAFVPYAPDEAI